MDQPVTLHVPEPQEIADQIAAKLLQRRVGSERFVVAIAGPPASGKSTVAALLVAKLNAEHDCAALIPMDGFHLDNSILHQQGLLDQKGAPSTFDVAGFRSLVRRLKSEQHIYIPTFDRDRELAVSAGAEVKPEHNIAVVEGNYLLYNQAGWRELAAEWDFSVFMRWPEELLRDRLIERWKEQGFSKAEAIARAEVNDLRNAKLVLQNAMPADLTINA